MDPGTKTNSNLTINDGKLKKSAIPPQTPNKILSDDDFVNLFIRTPHLCYVLAIILLHYEATA